MLILNQCLKLTFCLRTKLFQNCCNVFGYSLLTDAPFRISWIYIWQNITVKPQKQILKRIPFFWSMAWHKLLNCSPNEFKYIPQRSMIVITNKWLLLPDIKKFPFSVSRWAIASLCGVFMVSQWMCWIPRELFPQFKDELIRLISRSDLPVGASLCLCVWMVFCLILSPVIDWGPRGNIQF